MKYLSILFAFLMFAGTLTADAAFVVRSVKGNVTATRAGKPVALKAGMTVSPGEKLNVPEGAVLSVKNDVNNNIYTSTKAGSFTLSRMMLDADVSAGGNITAINERLKVGGGGLDNGKRVYVEQGMVKRSLSEYDPQASGFSIDPKTLARCVREWVPEKLPAVLPFTPVLEREPDGSLAVEMTNREEFPIYFNIISKDGPGTYTLSCLGQPAGSYVLLPRQSISRRHRDAVDPDSQQMVIIANCQFDVDALLENINNPADCDNEPVPDFPLYIMNF